MAKTHQLLRWATTGVCFAFLSASCTTVMYNGPRRPSEKVAKLTSSNGSSAEYCGTKIVKLDGKDVKDGTFELLPGLHKVKVDSNCKKAPSNVLLAGAAFGLVGVAVASTINAAKEEKKPPEDPTLVCWKAKPGREYTVRTLTEGGIWQIELVDDETSDNVKDFCD